MNLGRPAKRLQQSIEKLEARRPKRLFANCLVKAEYDGVRSSIADLGGDDVSQSAPHHEVGVPFVATQFRRGKLFGEPTHVPSRPLGSSLKGSLAAKRAM